MHEVAIWPIKSYKMIANLWLVVSALSFLNAERQGSKQHIQVSLWNDSAGLQTVDLLQMLELLLQVMLVVCFSG